MVFADSDFSDTTLTPAQLATNQVARLTTLLTLTSDQQASALTIFETEQTAVTGLRTNLQTAETALETAIEANDTTAISTQTTLIGTLTAQTLLARATAQAAFYALLTADQKTKYATLHSGHYGFGDLGGGGLGGVTGGGGHHH